MSSFSKKSGDPRFMEGFVEVWILATKLHSLKVIYGPRKLYPWVLSSPETTAGSSFCLSIFYELVHTESTLKHLNIPPDSNGSTFFPHLINIEVLPDAISFHSESKKILRMASLEGKIHSPFSFNSATWPFVCNGKCGGKRKSEWAQLMSESDWRVRDAACEVQGA